MEDMSEYVDYLLKDLELEEEKPGVRLINIQEVII